jgi:hypothetical protein
MCQHWGTIAPVIVVAITKDGFMIRSVLVNKLFGVQ